MYFTFNPQIKYEQQQQRKIDVTIFQNFFSL